MTFEITITKKQLIPLALLEACGHHVEGKTRLQKLAFLVDELELGNEELDAYHFRKYDYGPFSKELLQDTEELEEKGLVEISTTRTLGGNKRYDYELTEKGKSVVDQLYNDDLGEKVSDAADTVCDKYGDLPLRTLVEKVYEQFPEYKENSVYQY